jgi:hypothetical protein
MIRYEVTLECSADTAPELEQWMRNVHIPDMLATSCFAAIHFDRAEGRCRTVYQAASGGELERYLTTYATAMRQQFQQRFPVGVAVSRETWEQVQRWSVA